MLKCQSKLHSLGKILMNRVEFIKEQICLTPSCVFHVDYTDVDLKIGNVDRQGYLAGFSSLSCVWVGFAI